MTRAELMESIRRYLNRPNFPEEDLSVIIAAVEGELSRALREHPRSQRRTTYTQPAGDNILPFPYDLMQMITLAVNGVNLLQYPADLRQQAAAVGNAFIQRGDSAELFPAPEADTVYQMDYIAKLKPLETEYDTNWVLDNYSDLYLYGALKEAAVYLKDDARLGLWTQEFQRRLQEVIAQGWGANWTTAPRIRLG